MRSIIIKSLFLKRSAASLRERLIKYEKVEKTAKRCIFCNFLWIIIMRRFLTLEHRVFLSQNIRLWTLKGNGFDLLDFVEKYIVSSDLLKIWITIRFAISQDKSQKINIFLTLSINWSGKKEWKKLGTYVMCVHVTFSKLESKQNILSVFKLILWKMKVSYFNWVL